MPIIAFSGPRTIHSAPIAEAVRASGFLITKGITGEGDGLDQIAKAWIIENLGIENYQGFPAKWNDFSDPRSVRKYRRDGSAYNAASGPIRNGLMLESASALIAFPNCKPDTPRSGTWDCIRQARAKGLPVFLWPMDHKCDWKVETFSEDTGKGVWVCWCGEKRERTARILCAQVGLFG